MDHLLVEETMDYALYWGWCLSENKVKRYCNSLDSLSKMTYTYICNANSLDTISCIYINKRLEVELCASSPPERQNRFTCGLH